MSRRATHGLLALLAVAMAAALFIAGHYLPAGILALVALIVAPP